jgi:hypothetical protein
VGIVAHDGQGLPDIVPQGFKLTFGEVKAICDDPESEKLKNDQGDVDMDWTAKYQQASNRTISTPLYRGHHITHPI